eukprot:TRINITY_DN36168_c0_g1_i1.p1 TRINITY_DN36168_c0_g1~~TRINITY_DN36168_c0_g1_i1.p1  ORF type:complete len:181 (+),score=1.31 TRINITY_DN36168_c0_g1_i1:242-784(+)
MKQESNKDFEFKEIITLRPLLISLIVLLVVVLCMFLYYLIMGVNFKLSFVMIIFAIMVLGVMLILKANSSTVSFSFTKDSLIVNIGRRMIVCAKQDIIGLYSLNYNLSKSSRMAFEILFKDGKSLYFSDVEFNDKKEESKHAALKKFLNTFLIEADLPEFKKIKSLNINRMGQYFYYKTN